MTDSSTRMCRGCDGPMPEGAHFNARYCGDQCRKEAVRQRKSDPEYRERQRQYMLERYQKPEVRARAAELRQEYANDPEKTAAKKAYSQRPEQLEKSRVRSAEYRGRPGSKERAREYMREYEKRESRIAWKREWTSEYNSTEERKRRNRETSREFYQSEKGRKYHHEYARLPENRSRKAWHASNRRAGIRVVTTIDFSREEIAERDGNVCYMCGREVSTTNGHIDHLIPLAKGGTHEPNNVALSCAPCNHSKNASITPEAIAKRGKNMMDSLREALQ